MICSAMMTQEQPFLNEPLPSSISPEEKLAAMMVDDEDDSAEDNDTDSSTEESSPPTTTTTTMTKPQPQPLFLNFTSDLSPQKIGKKKSKAAKRQTAYRVNGVNILNRNNLDSKTAIERIQRRRENHNHVERRRRDNINNAILELSQVVPNAIHPGQKPNKGNILKLALDYIKALQAENTLLKNQLGEPDELPGGEGAAGAVRTPMEEQTYSMGSCGSSAEGPSTSGSTCSPKLSRMVLTKSTSSSIKQTMSLPSSPMQLGQPDDPSYMRPSAFALPPCRSNPVAGTVTPSTAYSSSSSSSSASSSPSASPSTSALPAATSMIMTSSYSPQQPVHHHHHHHHHPVIVHPSLYPYQAPSPSSPSTNNGLPPSYYPPQSHQPQQQQQPQHQPPPTQHSSPSSTADTCLPHSPLSASPKHHLSYPTATNLRPLLPATKPCPPSVSSGSAHPPPPLPSLRMSGYEKMYGGVCRY
ncbi:uncharacterized protein BYT42DRAFT_590221 [Radiomyces spectabilis]|uniref:uncharacterized protein n=1 Tax=Radiomyces spectabilis TaxID=64574 RepID=UPI00222103C8|nr:uncharacterized protein BYT42DRAFT_590221 [Radiomyces spectabilis]KAI8364742.1 hypothetical protein BYT42DRAFT_590221 [Radiomyces spectabilis]